MIMKANSNGYVQIKNTKQSTYQHRIEAEVMLGRELLEGETVHHIDANRSNNEWSNLLVFKTNGDHARHHKLPPEKQRLEMLSDGSYVCISLIPVKPTKPKRVRLPKPEPKSCCMCGGLVLKGTYCSLECSNRSKSRQPERKERGLSGSPLWKKVWAHPMTTIAKELGVSDKAVRKWCVGEGIPLPPRGYWRKVEVGALEEGLCCPLPTIP